MIRRVGPIMALMLAVACTADTPSGPTAYRVAVALDSVAIRAGDSIAPVVMVTVNGVVRAANSREILVSSSDTAVIAVASNGALMAVGHGSATVTVRWAAASSIAATQLVTVLSEDLAGVSLVAPPAMIPGDTAAFVVTGRIRGGRSVPSPASVTVTSRNSAVVTTGGNQAIAVAPGEAWIVAMASTGVSDSSLVTVAVGAPVHIIIVPHSASITAGMMLPTTVAMTDRRNNLVTTVAPAYTSSSIAIATAQSDGTVSGKAAGSALIIVQAGTVADTLRLIVMSATAVLTRLVVFPDSVTLNPGGATPIQVQAIDAAGNPMTLPTLSWQSQTAGVTVTSTGVIQAAASISTPISNGVVQVSSGAISARVRVAVVIPPPVLTQLLVSPDSVTLSPGGTVAIQVQALDARGAPMTPPALTWQSQTSGITVTSAGVIQAATSISSTIANGVVRVSSGTIAATVRVAVVVVVAPPPADSGFVQIVWVGGTPSAAVAAAFEAARTRINGLFKSFNGVSPLALNLPASTCMAGAPALVETVPGIVIFAQVTPIDGVGGILGSAGPCMVRSVNWLPIVGEMQFDSADMDAMVASGMLNGVVLHEMMHTLGFGVIWGPGPQDQVASPGGADPRYLGAVGVAAYAALGAADAATGAPVENTGGSGTRGSHWREAVFHTELMTGWADGSMPMSRVTIGVLKDFGYDVDLNKADPFTLSSSLVGAGLRASQLIVEQTIAPIGVVGPDGKITPYNGPVMH